jgi:hypothetical protein
MRLTPVAVRVSTASTPLTRYLYVHTWRLRLFKLLAFNVDDIQDAVWAIYM